MGLKSVLIRDETLLGADLFSSQEIIFRGLRILVEDQSLLMIHQRNDCVYFCSNSPDIMIIVIMIRLQGSTTPSFPVTVIYPFPSQSRLFPDTPQYLRPIIS